MTVGTLLSRQWGPLLSREGDRAISKCTKGVDKDKFPRNVRQMGEVAGVDISILHGVGTPVGKGGEMI